MANAILCIKGEYLGGDTGPSTPVYKKTYGIIKCKEGEGFCPSIIGTFPEPQSDFVLKSLSGATAEFETWFAVNPYSNDVIVPYTHIRSKKSPKPNTLKLQVFKPIIIDDSFRNYRYTLWLIKAKKTLNVVSLPFMLRAAHFSLSRQMHSLIYRLRYGKNIFN